MKRIVLQDISKPIHVLHVYRSEFTSVTYFYGCDGEVHQLSRIYDIPREVSSHDFFELTDAEVTSIVLPRMI